MHALGFVGITKTMTTANAKETFNIIAATTTNIIITIITSTFKHHIMVSNTQPLAHLRLHLL